MLMMMNHARLWGVERLFRIAAVVLSLLIGGCTEVAVRVSAETNGQTVVSHDPDGKRKSLDVDSFVIPKKALDTVNNPSCSVPVDLQKQETISWCWAASAKMAMMPHLKKEFVPQQCSIAESVLNPSLAVNCCSPSSNTIQIECIQGGWPEWAFKEFGFDYQKVKSSEIQWEHLVKNVCDGFPLIYAETYTLGSGHTYIIGGLREVGDVRMVDIYSHDPDLLYAEDPTLRLEYRERRYETLSLQFGEGDSEGRDETFFYINIRPKS